MNGSLSLFKLFGCLCVFVPCSVHQKSSTVQQKRGSGASKIEYTRLLLTFRTYNTSLWIVTFLERSQGHIKPTSYKPYFFCVWSINMLLIFLLYFVDVFVNNDFNSVYLFIFRILPCFQLASSVRNLSTSLLSGECFELNTCFFSCASHK